MTDRSYFLNPCGQYLILGRTDSEEELEFRHLCRNNISLCFVWSRLVTQIHMIVGTFQRTAWSAERHFHILKPALAWYDLIRMGLIGSEMQCSRDAFLFWSGVIPTTCVHVNTGIEGTLLQTPNSLSVLLSQISTILVFFSLIRIQKEQQSHLFLLMPQVYLCDHHPFFYLKLLLTWTQTGLHWFMIQ